MPNVYARGNVVRVRFAFPSRALTTDEKNTYTTGGNLPAGVGFDPTVVKFDQKGPGASVTTTYTYPTTIVRESAGQYSCDVDTSTATVDGDWFYRGYSTGTGQAAIEDSFFVEHRF